MLYYVNDFRLAFRSFFLDNNSFWFYDSFFCGGVGIFGNFLRRGKVFFYLVGDLLELIWGGGGADKE